MKLFAILGLALAASSMVSGLALKGQSSGRLSQQQEPLAPASLGQQEQDEQPMPYQFSYEAPSEDNTGSSRSEVSDGTGRVYGSYAIKGADGISRIVSYTADSEGFRANITTNEPGTESQNPSFIVLQSSQLPASEITKNLQSEEEANGQQQEPLEPAELPAPLPAKSLASPRKGSAQPAKPARRPIAQSPAPQLPQQPQQISLPAKGKRPAQTQQVIAPPQPSKRPNPPPAKGATRSRNVSKSIAAPATSTTTQRPRPTAAPKRQLLIQQQPQEEEPVQLSQLSQSADQGDEAADEESSQEGF